MDALESGEIEARIDVETRIQAPGYEIREYRFRFNQKRRALIRDTLVTLIDNIDANLRAVRQETTEILPNDKIASSHWDSLRERVAQIDVLLGSAPRPSRWGEMRRHLGFGQGQDLLDIEKTRLASDQSRAHKKSLWEERASARHRRRFIRCGCGKATRRGCCKARLVDP